MAATTRRSRPDPQPELLGGTLHVTPAGDEFVLSIVNTNGKDHIIPQRASSTDLEAVVRGLISSNFDGLKWLQIGPHGPYFSKEGALDAWKVLAPEHLHK